MWYSSPWFWHCSLQESIQSPTALLIQLHFSLRTTWVFKQKLQPCLPTRWPASNYLAHVSLEISLWFKYNVTFEADDSLYFKDAFIFLKNCARIFWTSLATWQTFMILSQVFHAVSWGRVQMFSFAFQFTLLLMISQLLPVVCLLNKYRA